MRTFHFGGLPQRRGTGFCLHYDDTLHFNENSLLSVWWVVLVMMMMMFGGIRSQPVSHMVCSKYFGSVGPNTVGQMNESRQRGSSPLGG